MTSHIPFYLPAFLDRYFQCNEVYAHQKECHQTFSEIYLLFQTMKVKCVRSSWKYWWFFSLSLLQPSKNIARMIRDQKNHHGY